MNSCVPTKKPKIQGYVSPELYERVEDAARNSSSMSEFIEDFFDEHLEKIPVELSEGDLKEIAALAKKDRRSLADQIAVLAVEALKHRQGD